MARPAGSVSIGEMARMNKVSLKALRLWQERGLLEPAYVDEETGYRYYRMDQCPAVDDIVQLRAMGFSLEDISELLRQGDIPTLRASLESRLGYIVQAERQLADARASLAHFLRECDACEEEVLCDQVLLERTPERRALYFDVGPVDIEDPSFDSLAWWELTLREVKERLGAMGAPSSLFRNVGCVIRGEDLASGRLVVSRAAVFVDEAYEETYERAEVVPACQRLAIYERHSTDVDGEVMEAPLIRRMLDYMAAKRFEVAGDYMGETLADTPLFGYVGRDAFFKATIPVRRA